jgi:hypothetical protein
MVSYSRYWLRALLASALALFASARRHKPSAPEYEERHKEEVRLQTTAFFLTDAQRFDSPDTVHP